MVREYKKGAKVPITGRFNSRDFDCNCSFDDCLVTYVDDDLVVGLVLLEAKYNSQVTINSGFRCTRHNKNVGGKVGSIHLTGKAADVEVREKTGLEISDVAKRIPCFRDGGIGVYKTFAHLDVRGYKARWVG